MTFKIRQLERKVSIAKKAILEARRGEGNECAMPNAVAAYMAARNELIAELQREWHPDDRLSNTIAYEKVVQLEMDELGLSAPAFGGNGGGKNRS